MAVLQFFSLSEIIDKIECNKINPIEICLWNFDRKHEVETHIYALVYNFLLVHKYCTQIQRKKLFFSAKVPTYLPSRAISCLVQTQMIETFSHKIDIFLNKLSISKSVTVYTIDNQSRHFKND